MKRKHTPEITDTNQTYWQLAAIQLTGVTSLPVMFSSVFLIQSVSFFNALFILILTNLILWVIRYVLISMSFHGRKSVMDLAEDYFENILGWKNCGIYAVAALLLLSTLFLFIVETTTVSDALTRIFPIDEGPSIDPFMQISVIIGVLSTIFCTRGIVALRWLSVISLPIMLLALLVLLVLNPTKIQFIEHKSFSIDSLPFILAINLSATSDLPTFFRHGKSWNECIWGLNTIQIVSLILAIAGLFLGAAIQPLFESSTGKITFDSSILLIAITILISLSAICSNVYNVYGASVGWEVFCSSPFQGKMVGQKEYLIIGFLLTLIYLAVTQLISFDALVDVSGDSLVNLSLIFVFGYLIYKVTKRRPRAFEQNTYFLAWILSTLLNVLQYYKIFLKDVSIVFSAIGVIVLTIALAYGIRLSFLKMKWIKSS